MFHKKFELFAEFTEYEGSTAVRRTSHLLKDFKKYQGTGYTAECTAEHIGGNVRGKLSVTFTETMNGPASVAFGLRVSEWEKSNYLLMPGAVYNGNRFQFVDVKYPPFVPKELRDAKGTDTLITDIPRLSNEEMLSEIQLLSGDMTSPLIGFYNKKQQMGCILQTTHKTDFGYTGLFVKENLEEGTAEIRICAPGVREETYYRMTDTKVLSDDEGVIFKKGERVEIPFSLYLFRCESIPELFAAVFQHRYELEEAKGHPTVVPFSEAFEAIEQRFENAYYDETEHFYGLGDRGGHQFWQTGWVGGGIAGYPLLCKGNAQTKKHVLETLHFMFDKLQNENGWLTPMYVNGEAYGDTLKFFIGEGESEEDKHILLIRKNGDALYFVLRQLMQLREIGEADAQLEAGAKKLADAFRDFWQKYGQLGQFIDIETNEIAIGGSASGAIAGAALVLADQMFGGYLETAEEVGQYYCEQYLEKGLLNGGPGEILQCPDSESAFGLLESCVELCIATGKEQWKENAVKAAHHAASWVMSYDFDFPEGSTNQEFGMHSAGTVFANAQNKHSAPGICTLSGSSLLKLYRITKDPAFLRLLTEITSGLMQFVQTEKRLMPTILDKNPTPGCVCERVQTCDWEGKEAVGEILAPTSVWPEVSALLTSVEVPSIYVNLSEKQLAVFDHLEAALTEKGTLEILNPTEYDAEIEIQIDAEEAEKCRTLHAKAEKGQKIYIKISADTE